MLPKSPMGEAITYALNQWAALCVYLLDGDLDIDNNISENALRRIAVGRKNWLFCGSDNGGRTAAILFSLIATCQRHDVEPFAYLRDVLTRIASHPHHRLAELLPGKWVAEKPTPAIPKLGSDLTGQRIHYRATRSRSHSRQVFQIVRDDLKNFLDQIHVRVIHYQAMSIRASQA